MSRSKLSTGFYVKFFQRGLSMTVIMFKNNHGSAAKRALDRVIAKSIHDGISPSAKRPIDPMLFLGDGSADKSVRLSMACIDTIVADHFEVFLRDVSNELFNKVDGRNGFCNKFLIFMAVVVEGNGVIFFIISIDSGSSNHRSAKITSDVLQNLLGLAFAGLSIDVKAMSGMKIDLSLDFLEIWRKP